MLKTLNLDLSINQDRLAKTLDQLASIGKLPGGGVRRLAFSPEDIEARQLVRQWMLELGMMVNVDAAGNLIGVYPGKNSEIPALATGSHIDTVPSGGRYDGALGVVAGLEMVRTLDENNIQLNHDIKVIVFCDEEGTMIGSKAMSGTASLKLTDYRPNNGQTIQENLASIGGNWDKLATARQTAQHIAAFVELHVEQGGVLEAIGRDIGVVEGVVGQQRHLIKITGVPNHAGTTPMSMRRDALVAASAIVLAVEDMAKHYPGDPVATVGAFQVWPNAANIVPGYVEMTVDIRDLSQQTVDHLVAQLQRKIESITVSTRTKITIERMLSVQPTLATPQIQDAIVDVCQELNLTDSHLPSRASHDAQEMGRFTDMGMIFVPSQAGISHSEEEYTSPEQCAQGANVLLRTFLKLDAMY
ncbi:MAG: Zn-dependent hydrolase [Snowella sp.]|nr:Zn-dependent hydrolase [Snowella sp.]